MQIAVPSIDAAGKIPAMTLSHDDSTTTPPTCGIGPSNIGQSWKLVSIAQGKGTAIA
jgi:hypothetical protein